MLYQTNETMKLLGYQYPTCTNNKEFNNVLEAYQNHDGVMNHSDIIMAFVDFYNLGVIHGKKKERYRKKRKRFSVVR